METRKHVIVAVDDQPAILHTVALELRMLYQVRPFTSGQTALRYLEEQTASLIILDIDLPDVDGFTLAVKIRAMEKYKSVPIIFLTSNATGDYVAAAFKSGGNDFIAKPVERSVLLAKVAKFLP